jgi:hypothetical protein
MTIHIDGNVCITCASRSTGGSAGILLAAYPPCLEDEPRSVSHAMRTGKRKFYGTAALAVTFGVSAAVVACTAGPANVTRPAGLPTQNTHATSRPVGTATSPGFLGCATGLVTSESPGPQDVVAGPLSYPNAKLLSPPGSVKDFYGGGVGVESDGSKSYKMGTFVRKGATVTVSVVPQVGTTVRLQGPSASMFQRDQAVTYQACPTGAGTGWVGGFNLAGAGRSGACIPLAVRVKGEAQPRRVVLSFFKGVCRDQPTAR